MRDCFWLQQLIACSLLSSLLSEYSNGTRTSRVGLTWEQHCSCKIAFEVCCWLHLYVVNIVVLHSANDGDKKLLFIFLLASDDQVVDLA